MNAPHAPPSEWEAKFGARRREIDKKILEALERQIAAEEKNSVPRAAPLNREDAAKRIALAFGRPLT